MDEEQKEEQKKFGLAEIIILLILAVTNDILTVLADLVFLIPIVGQAIFAAMGGVNIVIWAIILFWFIMKAGFKGGSGMLQVAGGVAQFIGMPARTIVVALGIFFVNHPKVAAKAQLATGKIGAAIGRTEAYGKGVAKVAARNKEAILKGTPSYERELIMAKRDAELAAEGAGATEKLPAGEPMGEDTGAGKAGASERKFDFGMPEGDAIKGEKERLLGDEPLTEEAWQKEKPKFEEDLQKREEGGKVIDARRRFGRRGTSENAEEVKEGAADKKDVSDEDLAERLGGAYKTNEEMLKTMSRGIDEGDIKAGKLKKDSGDKDFKKAA